MLDIKYIRENPQTVQKAAKDKGIGIDVKRIIDLDKKYIELSLEVQNIRQERNALNESIKKNSNQWDKEGAQFLKQKLEKKEQQLNEIKEDLDKLLWEIPNLPLKDVPVGDETKFEVIRTVGKPTKFDFTPKDHLEIGQDLDIIDVQSASKVSGTRFGYLKNEGVLLEFALVNFALENLLKEDFIPVVPPALIKKEITEKLGYWHGKLDEKHTANENYYLVSDPEEHKQGLYLIGTGEHAIVPMHSDEILNGEELPKKYVAFSPCFRREAGSYGKDTKGIFRVHQFDKVEMVEFVKPEDDEKERKKMLSIAENLLQKLELPYRVIKLASQDLAFPTAETIDIEIWMPSQNKYRETHSISTTTDFQARRLNIKCKIRQAASRELLGVGGGYRIEYVHILNGTAFAIGRTIIAILENYQQKDGSILIPKVLHKYLNFTKISSESS